MALAYDSCAQEYYSSAATSHTLSLNNAAGNLIIVGVRTVDGDYCNGCTWDGTSLTRINKTPINVYADGGLYMFYGITSTTGTHNVVASMSSSSRAQIVALTYSGAKATGQPSANTGNIVGNGLSGTSVSLNCTTSNTGDMAVIAISSSYRTGYTPSNYTERCHNDGIGTLSIGENIPSPAGTVSQGASWTGTANIGAISSAFLVDTGASGPANLKSYNTNLKANIKSINTNLIANVKTLDTNS